uniref:Thrombospondin-like N-terminal domain-containing protein n=1 Tax=Aquila chrysaetos chrysaetos TaxID=223781 RepID=A0A663DMI3_AQUCH
MCRGQKGLRDGLTRAGSASSQPGPVLPCPCLRLGCPSQAGGGGWGQFGELREELLPPWIPLPGLPGQAFLAGRVGAAPGWGGPWSVPVDVLQMLGMQDGRDGVSVTAGICPQRPGTEDPDFAFRVDNRTQLSAPTRQLFPGGSFPEDFSILATVRARRGGQAFLLSIYDERGVQQLGMEIGLSPVFLYEDQEGRPAPEQYPVFRRVNLADGRWHRVALAVKGTNVSLLVDCHLLATLPLERGPQPLVSTEGVTIFGARLLDEEVFEGDVQQLLIVADPEAAHSYCQLYMPGCDQPLLYPLLAPFPEEVSTQAGKGKCWGDPREPPPCQAAHRDAARLGVTMGGAARAPDARVSFLAGVCAAPCRAARSPPLPHVGRARRERGKASGRARARRGGTRSCWSSTRPLCPPSRPAR